MSVIEDLRQQAAVGRRLEEERLASIEGLKDQITSVLGARGSRRISTVGYIAIAFPPITMPTSGLVFLVTWPRDGVNPLDAVTKKVFSTRTEDDSKVTFSSYNGNLKRTPSVTVEIDGVSKLTIATIGEDYPAMIYDYNPEYRERWRFPLSNRWIDRRPPSLEELTAFKSVVESIS